LFDFSFFILFKLLIYTVNIPLLFDNPKLFVNYFSIIFQLIDYQFKLYVNKFKEIDMSVRYILIFKNIANKQNKNYTQ